MASYEENRDSTPDTSSHNPNSQFTTHLEGGRWSGSTAGSSRSGNMMTNNEKINVVKEPWPFQYPEQPQIETEPTDFIADYRYSWWGATNRPASLFSHDNLDLSLDFQPPVYRANGGNNPDGGPFSHLPENEAIILRRQLEIPPIKLKYPGLFRYASKNEKMMLVVSAISAIAAGAALPCMTLVFGSLASTFQGFFNGTTTSDTFTSDLDTFTLYYVYLGIGEFVVTYIYTVGFIHIGERITGKIREEYFRAVLRQNIGYFDKLGSGEMITRITGDTNLIQDGLSHKVGLTLSALATFFSAYVIGFIKYWKLTLILTSSIVAIFITTFTLGRFVMKFNRQSLACYGAGGTVAEEVISSIRNAVAFGTQKKLADKYDAHLQEAEKSGFKMKALTGSMIGFLMCYIYLTYALAFWQGSQFITDGESSLSSTLTILLAIMIGSFALSNVAPNIQAIGTATAAANKIFATIDRKPPLDPSLLEGEKIGNLQGNVELRGIKHIYPSRPEVVVMDDVDLFIPAGKTTALVGASGSGKSTIIGLVERFYDPIGGTLYLDGVNVQDLNLRWLRQNISLVSQEPTLFATTIANNIRHGLIGTPAENLTDEDTQPIIENAAKMSNAHDFITALPEGYNTHVGERGFLLSGGQKQRIAIARAIVSDPKILLLDEATSALDTKSEGVVQAALDKASQGRTTIVIAHRLSTIRDADNIVVMSRGKIVEQGTHNALLAKKSAYYNLVQAQKLAQETEQRREAEAEAEEDEASSVYSERLCKIKDGDSTSLNSALPNPTSPGVPAPSSPSALSLARSRTNRSSQSKTTALANRKEALAEKYSLWTLLKVILSFNRPEKKLMIFSLLAAIICGGGQPTQSVFFAKNLTALSLPPSQYSELLSDVDFWCWMYFMLAFVLLAFYVAQGTGFAWCSEKLIHRARERSFRAILRQDIGWFDREENSAGALVTFLSTETTHLAGMSGVTLGTILLVTTTLVAGFTVAIVIQWKLALVCVSTVPVVLACGFLRFTMLSRFQARSKKAYASSASYACEAASAIRTVASLTREEQVLRAYHDQLAAQEKASLKSVLTSSTLYAASQSLMFLCIALGFWWGGTLISEGEVDLFQFYLCFQAVIFGAQSAGTIFSFAPDMGKAKGAAAALKQLFDRKPEIDTWSEEGEHIESVRGEIEFRDVHFRYPTRPEQPVLRGLDLNIQPGQYVALVGASGCGKSTTIALLERFYNPLLGGIFVDGKEISSLNVNAYRKHIALVSQEPTLYQGTIRENILLGANADDKAEDDPGDVSSVSEDRVKQVCKDANIYDFIMSLPDGFETLVGSKGSMLSGGQKQRIAIARALLRNPRILLLDEATSALDSESEKIVQEALDKAAKGRTTIAVAHRLSTIQKADRIYVFDAGRVVESGTHGELLAKRGRYFELVNLQSLGRT